MYVRNRPVWNSKKYGAIKLTLQFDKDGNAVSACNDATDGLAQIIVTELKLCVPCFKITGDFDNDLSKVHNEVQTFESYRVFPMSSAATQQTLTIQAGLNNVTGIGLLSRITSEENKVGDLDTPAAVRYLTGCPNARISNIQVQIGDVLFPRQPITNSMELYNFNKDFLKLIKIQIMVP